MRYVSSVGCLRLRRGVLMFSTELFPTSETARVFTETCLVECGARSCATCLFTAEACIQIKGSPPYATRAYGAQYQLIRDVIRPAMIRLGFDPASGDTLELLIDRTRLSDAPRIGVLLRQTAQYRVEHERLVVFAGSPAGVWWPRDDEFCQWQSRKLAQITQELLPVYYEDDPVEQEVPVLGLSHWLLPPCWSCPLSVTAESHWLKPHKSLVNNRHL